MPSLKPPIEHGTGKLSRRAEADALKHVWRFSATFSFRDIKSAGILRRLSSDPATRSPSQSVPVIVNGERGHEAKLMKWGLVPSWSPDPSIGNRMINARAETLLETSFKRLVSERRCIIPGKGYLKVERIWLEPLEGIDT